MMTFLAVPVVIFAIAFVVGIPIVLIQRAMFRHKELKASARTADKAP